MQKRVKELSVRVTISILLIVLSVLSFRGVINNVFIDRTFLNGIDRQTNAYLDDALKKSLITYAVVRGLNAVISVVQESDVAVSPAGVGITVAVGEILDPVNDIIERFSWIVLASTTSLGIQKILYQIGRWAGFEILLSIALLVIAAGLWSPWRRDAVKRWGYLLLILAFIVRFTIPLVAVTTDSIDTLFLEKTYEQASASLKTAGAEYEEVPGAEEGDAGLWGKIRSFLNSIDRAVQLEERIRDLKEALSRTVEQIVDLMVVFLLKTILIPLLMLWIFMRLAGRILHVRLVFPRRLSHRQSAAGL